MNSDPSAKNTKPSQFAVQHSAIAVVGMACVFPGAPDVDAFWSLLEEQRCAVIAVPPERWDMAGLPDYAAGYAGFIDDAACFDPAFFGISPKEAAALDPRQRLCLQVAWHALEDAGIAADNLKEARLGIFIGAVNGEFLGNFSHTDDIQAHMGIGMSNAVIANRISHVLGLRGPSMSIDTACSSSLVAVHQACRSLQAGDADMVLAGGVSLMLRPDSSVALGKGGMLAPDGLCKTFDASANGYGRGEGCGLLLLKRLDDALADGDRIHAVIRGSASNHDGVSNGITAPNGLAQESLIKAALADAGMQPADIQYVEAHGTGTLLGDPTETRALGRSLGQHVRLAPLLIGSVKTNIGHLEAAAGIAGLIKLVLALKNKKIPASLHYSTPNPHINFTQLGLQVAAKTMDWPVRQANTAYAGSVSAFGFGGANCHVVVQEFVVARSGTQLPLENRNHDTLVLSATSAEGLRLLAQQSVEKIRKNADQDFSALCQLARSGRASLRHRLAVTAKDSQDALIKLETFLQTGYHADVVSAIAARRTPRLVFLCPGQGAQRPGMACDLLKFPVFRATIQEADHILPWSLTQMIVDADTRIDMTAYTQPALLATGVALARLLADYGVKPQALAGHSLGEYTAAVIAGGIDFAQALKLVALRGRLMEALKGEFRPEGAMAAVRADQQTVSSYLLAVGIDIAAVNGPQSTTISGPKEQLEHVLKAMAADGIRVRSLRVNTAFHSALLAPMLDEFAKALQEVDWRPLQLPVTSNLTGELFEAGHIYDAAYWLKHTRQAVRFADNIAALGGAGIDTALELGAVPVLSGMLEDNQAAIHALPCLMSPQDAYLNFLNAIAQLHVRGAKVLMPHTQEKAAGDALPLYPFAKDVFPLRLGMDSFSVAHSASVKEVAQAALNTGQLVAGTGKMMPDAATIRTRIIAIVAALLAMDATSLDASAPLLEIGADSLILMQAVGRIENEFSVKIPVRAFFEDLTTIDAVAAYLAEKQQGTASTIPELDAVEQRNGAMLPEQKEPQASSTQKIALHSNLSVQQRQHLDQFTTRYCARTHSSKQQAQKFRHVLADSRASAGFRFSIKEMLYPIVGQRAAGSKIWDVDGNEYIDISMGFGVQLFGHEPEFLKSAIAESLSRGIRIGPQSDLAGEVAELICELTGVERVSFCSSGTEAIMTALRLARTATGRRKIAIFRDSYHGHFDGVLGEINDDPWTVSPRVAGITPGMVNDLAIFEYGSASALEQLRSRMGEFAAVLVEPVQSRNPGLQPLEFLRSLRSMTRAAGSILIFDEVLVGFRIHPGGAQAHFGVQADLVTYGKIVGGGLPVGVIAGRADIMAGIDGGMWQYGDDSFPAAETTFFAGTFNKHPLVMAAAKAVLTEIKQGGLTVYQKLNASTGRLATELDKVFAAAGAPISVKSFGSLFRFAFNENLDPFFYHLLHRGLYVWEGRNLFLSTAHTDDDITAIIERVADSVDELKNAGFIQTGKPGTNANCLKELPLSTAQRQLATLAALSEQGSSAYIVSAAISLQGQPDPAVLEQAFTCLVQRHAALRAAIDLDAGVQKIAAQISFAIKRHQVSAGELGKALQTSVAASFDLGQPGAFRVDLFEVSDNHAVLLLAAHHVFIDGQSMQILFEEFAALLNGCSLGAVPDYALLARRMAQADESTEGKLHKHYWLQKLSAAPLGIELPFARARAAMRGFKGARLTHGLDFQLLHKLEQKAGKLGMSSTMALIAAFAASLRRAGAGQDMVLGIPYSGRDADLARTPGYCAHLLPLRLNIPAQAKCSAVLGEVKREFLDAITHANYPLSQLVEDLHIARDPARPPLVNMTFNVDKLASMPDLPGLLVRPVSLPISHTRFDIGCNLVTWQDCARIEMDYDSELFDAADMQALLSSFVAMLERMAGDDQLFDERDDLRSRWLPARGVETETTPSLLERFALSVLQTPHAIAVQVDDGASLSRRQLDLCSDRLASSITAASHENPDGPIIIVCERGLVFPVAVLAAWKSAKAYLPLDPDLPLARLLDLILQAKPACVIVQASDDAEKIASIQALMTAFDASNIAYVTLPKRLEAFNESEAALGKKACVSNAPDACAYQLFTSGSTGVPKLVAVSHGALQHYLDAVIAAFDLASGLRYAVVSTFAADLGLTVVIPALFHSGSLLIVSNTMARDADGFAALMHQRPVDVLKIVPSHLEALLAAQDSLSVLPATHLILGGETASAQLLNSLNACQTTCRIFNHFGPTEATIGVMAGAWNRDVKGMRFTQPLGRNRLFILDAAGQACAMGEVGEIHIGGPGVAIGYVGLNEDLSGPFLLKDLGEGEERLYRTGDLAVLHADGSIQILGRKDEQIKIRGYRIEPAEIVAALVAQDHVAQATVILHKPDNGRASLMAFVAADNKNIQIDVAQISSNIRQLLPAYMLPGAVFVVDSLPYTANGKLDRKALLTQVNADNISDDVFTAEQIQAVTEQEKTLLALWRDMLGNDSIGPKHDFFQCGGDSIVAIQMIARLRKLGWHAKASDLFLYPVLKDFAGKVSAHGAMVSTQAVLNGECALLPAQLRLQELMQGFPAQYNLSVMLDLAIWVDADSINQALSALLHQHDALRLHFSVVDGKPDARFEKAQTVQLTVLPADANLSQAWTELQASLDAGSGRLLAASYLPQTTTQPSRLLLSIHHLVSDGVSMQIMLDDLSQALVDIKGGRVPGLGEKTCSVHAWASHLQRQARQDALLEEAEYWEVCTSIPPPELPGYSEGAVTESMADEAQVCVSLSVPASNRFLKGLPGATAEDIVIAAATVSLGTWCGEAVAYLELEGHGRQIDQTDLDISRTVGWLTSRYPAWFDLSDVAIADAARAIAEQRTAIPAHGIGYGLLRYLGPERIRQTLAQGQLPDISLNYLGQIQAQKHEVFNVISWTPEQQDRGPERALHLPRLHKLAIEALIVDGQLKLLWQFNKNIHAHADIMNLAKKMAVYIETMVAEVEETDAIKMKESLV